MPLTQVQGGMSAALVSGTAVASTSGTSIDFTGIPSWVKRITVMFNGVSTNGSSLIQAQLGTSGGVVTSGYACVAMNTAGGAVATNSYSSGIVSQAQNSASAVGYGLIVFTNISGNSWVGNVNMASSSATMFTGVSSGSITLGGTLDRVRITTVNGTDTFDAGSINILYE